MVVIEFKVLPPRFSVWLANCVMRRSSPEANFPRILEPEVLLSCWQTPSHWSLSWVIWIQPPQYYLITLRSIVILFSNLCLFITSGRFPSYFPTKPPSSCVPHSAPISSVLMWLSQQYFYSSRLYKIQIHSFHRGFTTRNPRLLSSAVIPSGAFRNWNQCLIITVAHWHSVQWRKTKER